MGRRRRRPGAVVAGEMLAVAGRSEALLGAERSGRGATAMLGLGVLLTTSAPLLWIISALMDR